MKLIFSHHSEEQMLHRNTKEEWVWLTFLTPELQINPTHKSQITYYFKRISEANNKVLRIVLKKLASKDEYLIVTCYFDKNMRNSI